MKNKDFDGVEKIAVTFELNTQPVMALTRANGVTETRPFEIEDFAEAITNHARKSIFVAPEMIATNIVDWTVFWRPPLVQRLLIAVDGSKEAAALNVPLPGLVCKYSPNGGVSLAAFLGAERPTEDTLLYLPPLPNISDTGTVCLGNTVRNFAGVPANRVDPALMWAEFFSSAFTSHSAEGMCQSFPNDVRLLLYELDGKEAFPQEELVPMKETLGRWI